MGEADGIVGEYQSLKAGTDADLLAMQVGDFYEFFGDDAETVSAALDLKVSQKSTHGSSYPMAGVPVAELTPYLTALVERGFRVAVAEQHETADGHAREVERVVTPGTLLEADSPTARHLAAVVRDTDGRYGVAFADVTTGRFTAGTLDDLDAVVTECYRIDPVELLPGPDVRERPTDVDRLREATGAAVTPHDADAFAPGAARHRLRDQFGRTAIESLGLDDPAVRAAAGIVAYVEASGVGVLEAMTRLTPHRTGDHVALDATTQRNLELLESMTPDGIALVDVLDQTVTAAGSRTLREWLTQPRRDEATLERRIDRVDALASAALARDAIQERLRDAGDLERLAARLVRGSANAHDLLAVRDTLAILPAVIDRIATEPTLADSPLAGVLEGVDRDRAAAVHDRIDSSLLDDEADGRVFQPGVDPELDDVIERHETALEWIEGLAAREQRAHGITHLQVDRNRTDGYYIQVGQSEVGAVPASYREIKTLKSSKRYETDELGEREREILRLEEKRDALEEAAFDTLRATVADAATVLQDAGRALAALDVYAGLAAHAAANGWTAPSFGGDGVDIEAGRHPVVEQTVEFVPNDASLAGDHRFTLVTGPNMSGKSTYLRGTALVVLLAQIGSFVPADRARIAPVDGIFTRVGALDELADGRSTFMVEMQELANILHATTGDSLVVLDEVGRGTATYDGISLAWAATEYLAGGLGGDGRPLVLFATHYHELTGLVDRLDGATNVHVAADERDGEVTFLRAVRDGPTDRSYGIHVAALAGVPAPVVERARSVLDSLRANHAVDVAGTGGGSHQVVFDLDAGELRGAATADGGDEATVDPAAEAVLDELQGIDVEGVAPLDLARRVRDWQRRLPDER